VNEKNKHFTKYWIEIELIFVYYKLK